MRWWLRASSLRTQRQITPALKSKPLQDGFNSLASNDVSNTRVGPVGRVSPRSSFET